MKISELEYLEESPINKILSAAAAGVIGAGIYSTSLDNNSVPPVQNRIEKQIDLSNELEDDEEDYQEEEIEQLNKKDKFKEQIVYLVNIANKQILSDRTKAYNLYKQQNHLSNEDNEWLDKMFKKYKIQDNDFSELMKRMDTVPVGLAVAQAALESGWGTSRLAQEHLNFFGHKSKEEKHRKFAKYDTPYHSIYYYIMGLNTHIKYESFRNMRSEYRKHHKNPDVIQLAKTLTKYSELGKGYTYKVIDLIKRNNLENI